MSTEITRKDRLAQNIKRVQDCNSSKQDLEVLPESYILPEQMNEFKEAFNKNALLSTPANPNVWIVKPSALS
jgi:hypothetical protein